MFAGTDQPDKLSDNLEARAACLVNPASGIASDYLNNFNEVLLLIENLPILLPEMVEELLGWSPLSYRQYFQKSRLPGSAKALQIYEGIDPAFRAYFESRIADLDAIALESISVIKAHRADDGTIEPDSVSCFCYRAATRMREVLEHTAHLVNNGQGSVAETAQGMADRLLVDGPATATGDLRYG